jgi:hypothetical protein
MLIEIKAEVNLSQAIPQQEGRIVFEYMNYPLKGKKPLSVLRCLDQDTICVIVLTRLGPIGKDTSHLFRNIIFNRLPKSIRKQLENYVIAYLVEEVIDKKVFEESYLDTFHMKAKSWHSPAGFIHGT